jgi:glycosyltransferase involved in cell wall biosynthesis
MSMKKPCVATRIPGINLISDPTTVELCEPNDPYSLANAIERILANSQRAELLAENARKRVLEHHTIGTMALAHENLYESLV